MLIVIIIHVESYCNENIKENQSEICIYTVSSIL